LASRTRPVTSQLRLSAVVEHNSVTVHNSATFFNGIVLLGAVSQSTIQGNKVIGDVGVAMGAGAIFPGDQIDQPISNRFFFNDIASVLASISAIFFDSTTMNNIVRGLCVSVIDLGTGNDVSDRNPRRQAALNVMATRQQQIQRALQAQSGARAPLNRVDPALTYRPNSFWSSL